MLARRRFVLLLVYALAVFAPAAAQVTINVDAARAEVETFAAEDAEDVRWTSPAAGSNVSNAFKIYRNYDAAIRNSATSA